MVSLNFTAIDFETANYSPASPCAVGLVKVRDGKVVDTFATVFSPPSGYDEFFEANIRIHGIRPSDVADGPTWSEVLPLMLDFIEDDVLIAHNASFDMGVLSESARVIGVELPDLLYTCTLQMSRRVFKGLDSHRLPSVAARAGYEDFKHHDALDDSMACAHIVMRIARDQGPGSGLDAVLQAAGIELKSIKK